MIRYRAASRYRFSGGGIDGVLSAGPPPSCELMFDATAPSLVSVVYDGIGFSVTASMPAVADRRSGDVSIRQLRVLLPCVHVSARVAHEFDALAVLVLRRSSVVGPGVVLGPLERYVTLPLHGVADRPVV